MFFTDDPELTKYGYYQVDNIKTFSKFEAWQLSGRDMQKVKYIFNDDVFSKLDWTKEPEEDIYELYRRRAQQLRAKYDYVVLIYSGGVDSHTVLDTFLQNNIHLNEILTFGSPDLIEKNKGFNQEALTQAVPFVQTLDLKKLNTKFRFVDIGKLIVDQQLNQDHIDSLEYNSMSKPLWFNTASSHVLKSSIKDHLDLVEKGKTICYIWGAEKPVVTLNYNYWCINYLDLYLDFGARQYKTRVLLKEKFNNFYDEPFYICREFPEISIKQGHMLARLMGTLDASNPSLKRHDELGISGPYVNFTPELFLPKKMVDKCIYPQSIMTMFGDDKLYNGSFLFSRKDNWFYQSNHEGRQKFINKMSSLVNHNQDFFKYRQDAQGKPFVFTIQPSLSRPYPIAKKSQ